MSKSVNKVLLVGNTTKDTELKFTGAGTAVANFTVATSERFKDKDGEYKERSEFTNVVAWAKLAEICGEYLKKGNKVYVEGRLQTRTYEDKQGQKRYVTEVVANDVVLLGESGKRTAEPEPEPNAHGVVIDDSDLPF